ncbi:hypothetical protein QQF64_024023 [Cirrhinus molitorella]|uniref:Uncharacterized protein n=1 Tax=Cirrhinus molitorella TaxID=172907 RepID=A0ABR3NK26_9TELE
MQKKVEVSEGHLFKGRRKEMEKRSGSAAGSGKKWRYSAVLSFLDPFVSPRETSGNMERGDEESQAAEGETEAAAAGSGEMALDCSEPGSPLPEPPASGSPSTPAAVPTGVDTKKKGSAKAQRGAIRGGAAAPRSTQEPSCCSTAASTLRG